MTEIIEKFALVAILSLVFYVIYKTIALYSKLKHYPTGAFPLPIFGNLLCKSRNWNFFNFIIQFK